MYAIRHHNRVRKIEQREDSPEMRYAVPRMDLHTNCAQENTESFGLIKNDEDPSLLREKVMGIHIKKSELPARCIASDRLCDFRTLRSQLRCLTLTAPCNTLCMFWLLPHRPQSPLSCARSAHCGSRTNTARVSVSVGRLTTRSQVPIQHCDVVLQKLQFRSWIAALSRHWFQVFTLRWACDQGIPRAQTCQSHRVSQQDRAFGMCQCSSATQTNNGRVPGSYIPTTFAD